MRCFEVAGRATLGVSGPRDVEDYVQGQMDPFRPNGAPGEVADVLLRPAEPDELGTPIDVHRPAGDGLVTASDGERLHLVAEGRRCAVPDPVADRPAAFAYEPGFPVAGVFRRFVRTALQLSMLRAEAVAVHSACVEVDGGAVLLAGWSETGKTETALA